MKTSIKSFAYVASAHIVKIASTYSDDWLPNFIAQFDWRDPAMNNKQTVREDSTVRISWKFRQNSFIFNIGSQLYITSHLQKWMKDLSFYNFY